MNISINTLSLNRTKAGMGNYIKNFVNGLSKIDKENQYFVFVSENNKHFFRIKQKNFRIINLGKLITLDIIRLIWEQLFLPLFLKKNKISVLHSPGFVIPIFSKVKNVLTIADMTFFTHPEAHTLMKRLYFKLFIPESIKRTNVVISISENTKKDIINLVEEKPDKIKVIHLAYGNEFMEINKEEARKIAWEKYGIKSKFIMFVGMIEPRKNLIRLLKAFSEVKKNGMPHKLVIVGKKGWKYDNIFKLLDNLNNVKKEIIFTGYVPDEDLAMLYNAAEVLTYPCLYEGFGIPILEAMACGCPVITSNISSMPEVAGDAALLVNPDSTEEIRQAITKVLSNDELRKEIIRKGKVNVKRFSWEKTARETLKVYESVYKGGNK